MTRRITIPPARFPIPPAPKEMTRAARVPVVTGKPDASENSLAWFATSGGWGNNYVPRKSRYELAGDDL
ncbi:hypothetical protein AN189_17530 [Loktanella sp. 3ANDIMAR09]|uniref:hypothetical protein n=1 Tax=Loktanella sp. 3ANDIMAR09 TaxID=1225657 RepID=UPI0006FE6933|nr:hypothetical protein [Loktanella sp. 3ANDIMAR09]KQI67025.1 hypothetical protein AN189_17530 [Loktanella sp. 3ANDIMAR09]